MFSDHFPVIGDGIVHVYGLFIFLLLLLLVAHVFFCHAYRASECAGYVYISLLCALLLTLSLQLVRLNVVILLIAWH